MRFITNLSILVVITAAIAAYVLYEAGRGAYGTAVRGGEPTARALPASTLADRAERQHQTAVGLGVSEPSQILFGDLHVHSSFSTDAFQLSLPMSGGEGLHPVADACDFARFCAQLDFWSINDHAASITARRWRETVETVRRCNAISGGGGADADIAGAAETNAAATDPDLISFLGWEWTQMGSTPENHYGHKNVILRDLADGAIPARPIAAAPPAGVPSNFDTGQAGRLALGVGAFALDGGHDMIRSMNEILSRKRCALDVPVRDLPADCSEAVETPGELFSKLDEWGVAATVIPHGTVWGMYTPAGSDWAKQLTADQHDPERQRLVEIYSGHGNAEEYRPWRATEFTADGSRRCPEPRSNYLPACWKAGEIIRDRCLAESPHPNDDVPPTAERVRECDARAARARQHFVDADRNAGPWTVPGLLPNELEEAGQCLDCFQPAFNYRPLGSVQYMLSLGRPDRVEGARRFRFGFIGSSDNHTARAGTGFKEVARRESTDARMGEIGRSDMVLRHRRAPKAHSERFDPTAPIPSVAFLETERSGSFFLTGGLAAVHARGRSRDAIWEALERRETYGTSGPRILLWFDLLDPKAPDESWPMGSEVTWTGTPTFRVRAAGSFEQNPGCPAATTDALTPERIESLCLNECYFPSDRRRPIQRIEVVRIRTQRDSQEDIASLVEDPWKVLPCPGDPAGCQAGFSDPEFSQAGRSTTYYVRAIETASPVIDADPLGCQRDEAGRCRVLDACFERPDRDDCRSLSEQRAWSSPIFLDPPQAG